MKFAHMADCHVGGWREPKLRSINDQSFVKAVDICISEKVDFVLDCYIKKFYQLIFLPLIVGTEQ